MPRMIIIDEPVDLIANDGEHVQVEIQSRVSGIVLYVHVDGKTMLRISHIDKERIELVDDLRLLQVREF